ncbi:MAG: hypothetical protein AAF449_23510, partial [Myxococcota bacterium]
MTIGHARLDAPHIRLSDQEVLTDLRLVASATIAGDNAAVSIETLEVKRDDIPIRVEGQIAKNGDALHTLALSASASDAQLVLYRPAQATAPIDVRGTIKWPAGTIPALIRLPILSSEAGLDLHVMGTLQALTLDIEGYLDRADVKLHATGPQAPLYVHFEAQHFDPSKVYASAPTSRLATTLTATVSPFDWPPSGRATLQLSGTTQLATATSVVAIRSARIATALDEGRLDARFRLAASIGEAKGTFNISPFTSPIGIQRAQLQLIQLRIDELSGGRLSGILTGDIMATGSVDTPEIEADIDAQALAADSIQLGDLTAKITFEKAPEGVTATWSNLRWAAPSSVWTSTSGFARVHSGRLTSPNFALKSSRGTLHGRADLDLADPFGPRSTAAIRLEKFQLIALKGIHDSALDPRGIVNGRIVVDGPQQSLNVDLDVQRSRWGDVWPQTNARIKGTLGAEAAPLDAVATGKDWGQARLKGALRSPADWRQTEAWTAQPWSLLRRLDLNFNIDLQRLMPKTFSSGT